MQRNESPKLVGKGRFLGCATRNKTAGTPFSNRQIGFPRANKQLLTWRCIFVENPVALEHTWSGDWAKLANCRRPWSRAGHRGFWFTFSTSCCQVILGLACVVRLNNLDFVDHRGRSCLVKTVWCKAKVWALTQLHSIKDKFKWHIKYVLYLFVIMTPWIFLAKKEPFAFHTGKSEERIANSDWPHLIYLLQLPDADSELQMRLADAG